MICFHQFFLFIPIKWYHFYKDLAHFLLSLATIILGNLALLWVESPLSWLLEWDVLSLVYFGFLIKLSASCLLGKCSTMWHTWFIFAFVIFQAGLTILARAGLGPQSSYASCIAGIIDMNHHTRLIYWDLHLANILPRLALNDDSPNACLLSSWDYRCDPTWLALACFWDRLSWHFTRAAFKAWSYWPYLLNSWD
jgi:hypothetical protein